MRLMGQMSQQAMYDPTRANALQQNYNKPMRIQPTPNHLPQNQTYPTQPMNDSGWNLNTGGVQFTAPTLGVMYPLNSTTQAKF